MGDFWVLLVVCVASLLVMIGIIAGLYYLLMELAT